MIVDYFVNRHGVVFVIYFIHIVSYRILVKFGYLEKLESVVSVFYMLRISLSQRISKFSVIFDLKDMGSHLFVIIFNL